MKYYFVCGFVHDPGNRKVNLSLKLKSNYSSYGFPEFFNYSIRDHLNLLPVSNLICNCFSDYFEDADYDHAGLSATLHGITCFETTRNFLASYPDFEYRTSSNVLKIISDSAELADSFRNAGIRFRTDSDNFSKLFDKPAVNLKGILVGVRYCALCLLYSKDQFANFEAFMDTNASDLFREFFLPAIQNNEIDTSVFYCFRSFLHYWLNGPHRDSLPELIRTNFKELLALECDIAQSRFIQNEAN